MGMEFSVGVDRREFDPSAKRLFYMRKYKRPLHHRISANRNRTYYDLKYHQQRYGPRTGVD